MDIKTINSDDENDPRDNFRKLLEPGYKLSTSQISHFDAHVFDISMSLQIMESSEILETLKMICHHLHHTWRSMSLCAFIKTPSPETF